MTPGFRRGPRFAGCLPSRFGRRDAGGPRCAADQSNTDRSNSRSGSMTGRIRPDGASGRLVA